MSTISNRFYITAIEDGSTLHGNLASDKTLTQAWSGTSATPDWTNASNQPTIYLTLLNGVNLVSPSQGYIWKYNGVDILFGSDGISTYPSGLFKKTTRQVQYGNMNADMPALTIIGNLAGYNGNVDMDTITLEGTYDGEGGGGVSFVASIPVRISAITGNGYIGVIEFLDGVATITEQDQTITMYGRLYDNSGGEVSCTTEWYVNDAGKSNGTVISGKQNAFSVKGEQIVDHAVIKCVFKIGADSVYTAYAGIDDIQDPEYMWIQYGNGGNGQAASLRAGESIEFNVWVGLADNPDVINTNWTTFKVQLVNSLGEIDMTSGLTQDIPNPDDYGYRTMEKKNGKGYITITYDTAKKLGGEITGIVTAYQDN